MSSPMADDIYDSLEEGDSGPFCPHWCDPSDCDEICKCGHMCSDHSYWSNDCREENCSCELFEDIDQKDHTIKT